MKLTSITNALLACPLALALAGASSALALTPPQPHLALQNQYSAHPIACWGVDNDAWSVQGYALGAPRFTNGHDTTVSEFIAWTQPAVELALGNYATTYGLDTNTTDILVLDIEFPVHPKDWGTYLEANGQTAFEDLMDGFILRINAARAVFEHAKLALYGVVVPMAKGGGGTAWDTRMCGYEAAGTYGVYDGLDYLVPVVYSRFSYDNSEITQGQLEAMVDQAITEADTLRTTGNSPIPLFPVTNFRIANGSSAFHGFKAEPSALAIIVAEVEEQIELIDSTNGVYGFWNGVQGGDSDDIPAESVLDPYATWTMPCYLYDLYGSVSCLPSTCP